MSEWIRAVPLESVRRGEAHPVALGRDALGRPREALVVLDLLGHPRAYLNRCEHIPIPLDGGSREFFDPEGEHLRCGTHGALYRLSDGLCVAGPCTGDSLAELPLRIVDGWVYVSASE